MHPKDAETIESETNLSTYNAWEAENLDTISDYRDVLNIEKHPAHVEPSENDVENVANDLLELDKTLKPCPGSLNLANLKDAVIHAHQWWIDYNRDKLVILRKDEDYARKLRSELLPNWQNRIKRMSECQPKEFPKLAEKDPEIRSTYTRLIAATLRMVHGADKGIDVFDHMLLEYLPMITFYERSRLAREGRLEASDRVQPLARWSKMRKGTGTRFDDLETFMQRVRYADSDITQLKHELTNLDELLAEIRTPLPVETQWIEDWCERASGVLERSERSVRAIDYGTWVVALLGFFGELTRIAANVGMVSHVVELISSAPFVEHRFKPSLSRLVLAAHGMPGSSGRYVALASDSLKSLKSVTRKRLFILRRVPSDSIENHFLPYLNRLEGSERSSKVVP
jgi:hypothetical protein